MILYLITFKYRYRYVIELNCIYMEIIIRDRSCRSFAVRSLRH